MSRRQNRRGAWSLLWDWILANLAGWSAGLALGGLLTQALGSLGWVNEDRFFAPATLIALGLTTGSAQATVLRRYLPKPLRWIAATLVGSLLCLLFLVVSRLGRFGGPGIGDDLVLLLLCGMAIGAAQWWILRRYYSRAGMWVLVTTLGLLCFELILANPTRSPSDLVPRLVTVAVLASAMQGMALVWLVRRPLSGDSPGAG